MNGALPSNHHFPAGLLAGACASSQSAALRRDRRTASRSCPCECWEGGARPPVLCRRAAEVVVRHALVGVTDIAAAPRLADLCRLPGRRYGGDRQDAGPTRRRPPPISCRAGGRKIRTNVCASGETSHQSSSSSHYCCCSSNQSCPSHLSHD